MHKNYYVKLVIDARYLNSVTDHTDNSWPLESVEMIVPSVNGKFLSASDLNLGLSSSSVVDSQLFYDLIKDSTTLHWTHEHEKFFQSIKDKICEDTILAVPSTDYPFYIHVVSSNVETGCILIRQFLDVKRRIQLEDFRQG